MATISIERSKDYFVPNKAGSAGSKEISSIRRADWQQLQRCVCATVIYLPRENYSSCYYYVTAKAAVAAATAACPKPLATSTPTATCNFVAAAKALVPSTKLHALSRRMCVCVCVRCACNCACRCVCVRLHQFLLFLRCLRLRARSLCSLCDKCA